MLERGRQRRPLGWARTRDRAGVPQKANLQQRSRSLPVTRAPQLWLAKLMHFIASRSRETVGYSECLERGFGLLWPELHTHLAKHR